MTDEPRTGPKRNPGPARSKPRKGRPRDPIPEELWHLREGTARAIMRLPDRYQAFAKGELKVADMDLEELRRGQLRDVNGDFSGPRPTTLPLKFYDEMKFEYIRRIEQENNDLVDLAFKALRDVLVRPGMTGDAKVKAANVVFDRMIGPVGSKIEITGEVKAKWEMLMEGGSIAIDLDVPPTIGSAANDEIVDAEVVENDL